MRPKGVAAKSEQGEVERARASAATDARVVLDHLRAAQTALDRVVRVAASATPSGADLNEEVAARIRDLDDGEDSARSRISSARRRVACLLGLLQWGD